jgi:hypothetical protein
MRRAQANAAKKDPPALENLSLRKNVCLFYIISTQQSGFIKYFMK